MLQECGPIQRFVYGGVGPFGDMVGWCPLPMKSLTIDLSLIWLAIYTAFTSLTNSYMGKV